MHLAYDGEWSGWESLGGGVLTSAPAVASWAPGRLDVFATGFEADLQHVWFADNTWSSWESLGGFDAGVWSGWETLGSTMTSQPAAVSWDVGRLDVFMRGTGNAIWTRWYEGSW